MFYYKKYSYIMVSKHSSKEETNILINSVHTSTVNFKKILYGAKNLILMTMEVTKINGTYTAFFSYCIFISTAYTAYLILY